MGDIILLFSEALETDLEWRTTEIALFKNQLNNFRSDEEKNKFRKLLVMNLYAHYEGFFRFSLKCYAETLNEIKIPLENAHYALVVSSLIDVFDGYEKGKNDTGSTVDKITHKIQNKTNFLTKLKVQQQKSLVHIAIPNNHKDKGSILNTESNLNTDVMEKILLNFGLLPEILIRNKDAEAQINQFLSIRNQVAHGDESMKDGITEQAFSKYEANFNKIVELIPVILRKALYNKTYLRNKP